MVNPAEEQLKKALAAGDFRAAEQLIPAFSQQIVDILSRPASRQEQEQALESFSNLLSLARVMRAHLSAQLSTLRQHSLYPAHLSSPEQHAWHYDA